MGWVRETLAPGVTEKQSSKEVQAAKQAAKEQGTASVFDALPEAVVEETKKVAKSAKPRAKEVRLPAFLFH